MIEIPEKPEEIDPKFLKFLKNSDMIEILPVKEPSEKILAIDVKPVGRVPGCYINLRVKKGKIRWNADTLFAYWVFKSGKKSLRKGKSNFTLDKRYKLALEIERRDGKNCWYCGEPLNHDRTIEHLLSLCHGGSNEIENLVLCHKLCNKEAGNYSVVDKVKLRNKKHGLMKVRIKNKTHSNSELSRENTGNKASEV
jgi:5-methylcytosine-specific restriction endonuclease McrA